MLGSLIDKRDSMQEQKGTVSRELEILRIIRKGMLEIKNTIAEMKNALPILRKIFIFKFKL